jgi:hypothetical protein
MKLRRHCVQALSLQFRCQSLKRCPAVRLSKPEERVERSGGHEKAAIFSARKEPEQALAQQPVQLSRGDAQAIRGLLQR